jgi:hypothetical protein
MASPSPDCPSHHSAETEIASVVAMKISNNVFDMFPHNVWCGDCQMWLNGTEQFAGHKLGKKHKKNLRQEDKDPLQLVKKHKKNHPENLVVSLVLPVACCPLLVA